jgi:hypothetical protein
MSASGGFHYAWDETHLFEENYDSSHNYVSFTSSYSLDPNTTGNGTNYGVIPTVDASDPNVVSEIENLCYNSPWTPTGNYFFGIYNGQEITASTVSAIESALSLCFS